MAAFMDEAFLEAQIAQGMGEVPVGCVFVYNGEIIARGSNHVNATKNATRHAEFVCVDETLKYCSLKKLAREDVFQHISVYVTVEPCVMCISALCNLHIKEICYGCPNDRFGGKTLLNVDELLRYNISCKGGYRADEAMDLLKVFYKGVNPAAPVSKVKV